VYGAVPAETVALRVTGDPAITAGLAGAIVTTGAVAAVNEVAGVVG
jgi:hypothetical protein